MNYVGIDLHKKTISICVVNQERRKIDYKRLACSTPETIVDYFRRLGSFHAVVEATASYEWLVRLLEPLAERIVLAHPKKLRVIAEFSDSQRQSGPTGWNEVLTSDQNGYRVRVFRKL